jgi:ATP-dependent DNA helicase RecQ
MTSQTSLISTASELIGDRPLRDFQRRACEALLAGRDVLLVAPTGAGKSLCYQLMTKITGRPTLVVSPLIALMDDQAAGSARLALKAACLHSGIEGRRQWMTVASWMSGTLNVLYTSPERLRDQRLLAALDANPPGLIVIDEAHCITTWGRRFRPAYRQIGDLARQYSGTPVLAMTATAKSAIQRDIADTLGLKGHVTVSEPLALTQITVKAVHAATAAERATVLGDLARRDDLFPMVIFCILRKHCEVVAALLRRLGLTAFVYHAGMPLAQRAEVSDAFQAGGGRTVLVATSAYEMGVNVPGIRSVIHYGLPASLESYVQGIGRAGRDGRPAMAILLYADADLDILDSLENLGCSSSSAPDDHLNLAAQDAYAFAATRSCRKAFLGSYFHPETRSTGLARCGWCDNCERLGPAATRSGDEAAAIEFELRRWRRKIAVAAGKPAFTVFTDRELARIAIHRPLSAAELADVVGIRRPSIDRYGKELIELVRTLSMVQKQVAKSLFATYNLNNEGT